MRSRVWFYLGKVRYQRGFFAAAEEAFGNVEGKLPSALDAEYHMLLAQSLMGQGRFADAAIALKSWDRSDGWLAYARFNLGVAFVRTNRVEEAIELTLSLMAEAEKQNAPVHLEVHRDTCTETPEKTAGIIERLSLLDDVIPD